MLQFSVIVPTHDRPQSLARCLEGLAALDFPKERFEVLVVDDASRVSPDAIVARFEERLDVRLLRQEKAGPAAARNTAARCAEGAFLAFIDDDCVASPRWLAELARPLEASPEDAVGGYTANALEDNVYSAASQLLIDYLYSLEMDEFGIPDFFTSNNLAVSRERFLELGGFDAGFAHAGGEDRDLCDRWRLAGLGMTYRRSAVVDHHHRMSLRTFARQHFTYGRGAYAFHRARKQRGQAPIRVAPAGFYTQMLRFVPSKLRLGRRTALTLLLLLSQFATAAGFFWERVRSSEPRR